MNEEEIREIVHQAVLTFFERDIALLQSGIREEALAHRLAIIMEPHLDGWHVDAEYNKRHREGRPEDKTYRDRRGKTRTAIPDIIVHHRQTGENLLVIELKRTANRQKRDDDYDKLRALKLDPYNYRHAAFLEIGMRNGEPVYRIDFV